MLKNLILAALLVSLGNCYPRLAQDSGARNRVLAKLAEEVQTDEEIAQNENAKYKFSTNIEDHMSDLSNQRLEVRDGIHVKGMYSYSDGYFRRTIHYEADDKGYRVTGEEVVPLEGPKLDPKGSVSVDTSDNSGAQVKYIIEAISDEDNEEKTTENEGE